MQTFVKDRMERAGMRWTIRGAQAMLDIRSVHLNDHWDEFSKFRIKKLFDYFFIGWLVWQSLIRMIIDNKKLT